MRTQAERVNSLHGRMEARKRLRERRTTGALRAAAAALAACLLLMIHTGSAVHPGGTAGPYSGATMLFEHAGAYVLVALAAFMAGTALTVAIIRRRRRSDSEAASIGAEKEEEDSETTQEDML